MVFTYDFTQFSVLKSGQPVLQFFCLGVVNVAKNTIYLDEMLDFEFTIVLSTQEGDLAGGAADCAFSGAFPCKTRFCCSLVLCHVVFRYLGPS